MSDLKKKKKTFPFASVNLTYDREVEFNWKLKLLDISRGILNIVNPSKQKPSF